MLPPLKGTAQHEVGDGQVEQLEMTSSGVWLRGTTAATHLLVDAYKICMKITLEKKIFFFFRLHCSPMMMIKLWLNVVCLLRPDLLIVIRESQEMAEQG